MVMMLFIFIVSSVVILIFCCWRSWTTNTKLELTSFCSIQFRGYIKNILVMFCQHFDDDDDCCCHRLSFLKNENNQACFTSIGPYFDNSSQIKATIILLSNKREKKEERKKAQETPL